MIKCLPEEVQTSLRSGVAIGSLTQCVEELVLNSIDAKATCVAIRVDLETVKVQAVDNGSGMGKEDLDKVGNRYFTSKCYSVEDLENLKFYGFRGEALASIATMASILEISSKTNKTAKTFLKLFHNGKGLDVCETELSRPSTGTTVTVYNLFHQLPVRRKCMDFLLEFERVRHKVEALSLMHPSVSFSLRNDASCSVVLQLPKTKDTCSRFSQIYGLGKSQKLREINYKSGKYEISGYISSEGHYNKNIQFLYVNNRLVLKTRLHKLINSILKKQSTICRTKNASSTLSPVSHRSGPELYGIFILNMKCQYDEYDVCLEPAKTLIEFHSWDAILACIEDGIKDFLKHEHLFIELHGEDTNGFNEENGICLVKNVDLQPLLPAENSVQESFKSACDNIADSYKMFNLQSKSVRRKTALTKGVLDHIGPTNNSEEIGVGSELTVTESVNEFMQVENLQPNKDDSSSDFSVLNNQKSNVSNSSQIEVVNFKHPEKCSEWDKSFACEINKDCSTLNYTEECDKGVSSQEDEALLENSLKIMESVGAVEYVNNEFKSNFVSQQGLEKHKRGKEDRKPFVTLNVDREMTVRKEPVKLCSAGLIAHFTQNLSPQKIENTNPFNRQHKLGPLSAKEIFEKKQEFSGQTPSVQACLGITSGRTHISNTDESTVKNRMPEQKNEIISLPVYNSKDVITSRVKEVISVVPSSSILHLGSTTQSRMTELSVKPRYCEVTKLSLHAKMGSLDRFRRDYGGIKMIPQVTDTEKIIKVEVPVCSKSLVNENTDLKNFSFCETPVKECFVSDNNGHGCLVSLEKSQQSAGENPFNSSSLTEMEKPLMMTDHSQIRKKSPSTKLKGTLASKVSIMKESVKGVLTTQTIVQTSEQFQACSSQKDECRWNCLSPNSSLQSTDQVHQGFPKIVRTKHVLPVSTPKQSTSIEISSPIARDTEEIVSHCFIDTDGEYEVLQKRSLGFSSKSIDSEGSCENTDIVERSTKQAIKHYTFQNLNLVDNVQGIPVTSNASENEDSQLHPSEWYHLFDVSLGRTVYINKMTGLSTYSAPPSKEPKAVCTKDISTLAVNVVENDSQGESLQSLFSEWENPVFARCPEVAVDVSSGQADNLVVKIHNILYPYRFTKKMIDSMTVLNQVDNKFIACLINTRAGENIGKGGNLLVLVDQHAAHERVRLEKLIADSYENQPEALGRKKLLASTVCPPLEIEITEEQRRLLRCCHKNLEDLGLELSFPENNPSVVLIGKVPMCFVEREANELRRGRQTVAKSIVQELIREQIELLQTTGGARGTLPLTVLKVLSSQACHGAIKFNDSLTLEDSCHLIEALSCCQLPFQCAHGRPSMLPLADIDHLQQETQPKPNLSKLRRMAKAWHLFGKVKIPAVKT